MIERIRLRLRVELSARQMPALPSSWERLQSGVAAPLTLRPLLFDHAALVEDRALRASQDPSAGELWDASWKAQTGKPVRLDPDVEEEIMIAASHVCERDRPRVADEFLEAFSEAIRGIEAQTLAGGSVEAFSNERAPRKQFMRGFPCALTFVELAHAVRVIAVLVDAPVVAAR